MPNITIGRDSEDVEKHGLDGTGLLGKHLVGEKEEAHMANPVYIDLARPHVMGIFGKRGTGKCLMPNEKILTEEGLEEVKNIFHNGRKSGQKEILEENEELFRFAGPKVYSISKDFSLEEKNVVAGYRKKVEEELLKIKTKSGREITITNEHPLLTVNGWKCADQISEKDKIGVPRKIETGSTQELKLPERFVEVKYSDINPRKTKMMDSEEEQVLNIADTSGSYYKMLNDAESKSITPIENGKVAVNVQGHQELKTKTSSENYAVKKYRSIKLPNVITEEFAEFMALLISEGQEQKIAQDSCRVILTNTNEKIISRFEELGKAIFNLEFRRIDQNSTYTNSKMLEIFLSENGYKTGLKSFEKSIPNFIISAKQNIVSQFLASYFNTKGDVTRQQIQLTTASRDIAEAIQYMLLRFGIVGRISKKKNYASNAQEHYRLAISGSNQLEKFREEIGFDIDRKSNKLENIATNLNTKLDNVPCGQLIKKCREDAGAKRTQIATTDKQSLTAYEEQKYCPSREKLAEIISSLEDYIEKVDTLKAKLEDNPSIKKVEEFVDETSITWRDLNQKMGYSGTSKNSPRDRKCEENTVDLAKIVLGLFEKENNLEDANEKLDRLKDLSTSDVFWDEVEKVEPINYEGWVYDLTVEDNHSFTAGFGGILCHNSYSMGTIAEELHDSEISDNLSTIIIDSMGVYWSMERPNERAAGILEEWGFKPKSYDANIYIPAGKEAEFSKKDIPYNETFTINPGELSSEEWCMALQIDRNSDMGVLLDRTISKLKETADENYRVQHIRKGIGKFDFDKSIVRGLDNRLKNAEEWGVFGKESSLQGLTDRGEMSIIDMSVFGEMSAGWSVRALVVGLLCKRILRERMDARRIEEIDEMQGLQKNEMPITWMLIDEAHQFLPSDGKTPATDPLLQWVKVGREPGVSLVLATQQPAKLHPNALSQCDLVLSHRLTAKQDMESLSGIMQTYMRKGIKQYIDGLPDEPGTGIVLDDNSERIFPLKTRPRKSWHAGGTPDAFDN